MGVEEKEKEIMELDGYSLGIEGALQRHAMKVDKVYTTLYAPTHITSVVSMGVSDLDKSVLLPDMALDWRRMRVFREAVFYLTCMVEGHPKKKMAGITVSGQRSGSRKNMMAFTPILGRLLHGGVGSGTCNCWAAADMGKECTATLLVEGAYMWALRARCLRALNVSTLAHGEKKPSANHILLNSKIVNILLKPAPYMAYKAWKNHIRISPDIPSSAKKMIIGLDPDDDTGTSKPRKSTVFSGMKRAILVGKESVVTRYLLRPSDLGAALEKAWRELARDAMASITKVYAKANPTMPQDGGM